MLPLLLSAWFLGAGLPTRDASSTREAVVWLVTDDQDDAVVKGARMGAEEMTRTSTLLGAKFVLRVLTFSPGAPVDIVAPAFLLLDLDESHSCDVAKRFAAVRGVITMSARVATGECAAPLLALRLTQSRRRAVLAQGGVREPGAHVEEWHRSLQRFGAQELNERYERRMHEPMGADAWAGWFATKLALETTLRGGTINWNALLAEDALTFDGHKGVPLRFDPSGVLRQPVYILDGSGKVIKEMS